jgi:hypothetical protein
MRLWRERPNPSVHRDFMSSSHVGGLPPRDNPLTGWVYFVEVCSFQFQFHSLEQIQECLDYFKQKVHPSTRKPHDGLEHYWQAWYERLPQWLFANSKRQKVVKALEKALVEFQAQNS